MQSLTFDALFETLAQMFKGISMQLKLYEIYYKIIER